MKPQGNEAGQISRQWHVAICKGLLVRTPNKLELNIGAWNVRSLYRAGVLKMLINRLSAYKADTVTCWEIWCTGSGILKKWDCILFYSCDNKDHLLGTGFLVSKRTKHKIIDFRCLIPSICTLRMRGKFFNCSIIKGPVPTEMSDN
jgi:hypothetical protein